jgi:hypothetical protein
MAHEPGSDGMPPVATAQVSASGAPALGEGPGLAPATAPQKRTRVLLSCKACRLSKLKCDRELPCSQCVKKAREDLCVYAPKPEKRKPAKGMSARLKRLENMVRGMIDANGNVIEQPVSSQQPQPQQQQVVEEEHPQWPRVAGQVFQGSKAMTYVGETHVMAILEDVSILVFLPHDSDFLICGVTW